VNRGWPLKYRDLSATGPGSPTGHRL